MEGCGFLKHMKHMLVGAFNARMRKFVQVSGKEGSCSGDLMHLFNHLIHKS